MVRQGDEGGRWGVKCRGEFVALASSMLAAFLRPYRAGFWMLGSEVVGRIQYEGMTTLPIE